MRFAVFVGLWSCATVHACTIPVFRYALDRWEADKFHLVLPASAGRDQALQELLRPLRANGKANMDITTSVDASLAEAELRFSRESDQRVWSGRLEPSVLNRLLESPARQKVISSILAGDSFIWVIAEGDSAADRAEVERIEKRLRFLEQVAALPIQDPNDPDSQLGPGPPLRLKFTTLRIRRDAPEEKEFLKMLAGPKAEIDPAATSFAAPVFGRGRVLGAWPLALLDDAALEEASLFLVGRCSCRMKNENPGWDLLLNVDWEAALKDAATTPAAVVPADAAVVVKPLAQPEVVTTAAAVSTQKGDSGSRSWLWAAGAAAVTFILAGVYWVRQGRTPQS